MLTQDLRILIKNQILERNFLKSTLNIKRNTKIIKKTRGLKKIVLDNQI